MDIIDLIIQEQNELIKNGHPPSYVYLGSVEMASLIAWAKDTFNHEIKYKADSGIVFSGLKCFEVATETHFNIV